MQRLCPGLKPVGLLRKGEVNRGFDATLCQWRGQRCVRMGQMNLFGVDFDYCRVEGTPPLSACHFGKMALPVHNLHRTGGNPLSHYCTDTYGAWLRLARGVLFGGVRTGCRLPLWL